MTKLVSFNYTDAKDSTTADRKVFVLKDRSFATQKVLSSSAEDSLEGLDLARVPKLRAFMIVNLKKIYDKMVSKSMKEGAYRKYLKSNINGSIN